MVLRDESTPEKRAIWVDVERAAANCPEWVKPMVEQAAHAMAERIRRLDAKDHN